MTNIQTLTSGDSRYRERLPQLHDRVMLADGGIETSLIYDDGLELPDFASFTLLTDERGRAALERYFDTYASIAQRAGTGVVLESATWRASTDWGARLGYGVDELRELNRQALAMMTGVRDRYDGPETPVVVSGCIGPRGDGYRPDALMSASEAEAYHSFQVELFADSPADVVTAVTMNYTAEAIGIANAARSQGLPAVISFTVETDGRLPTGETLQEAIEAVDAATGAHPAYYMVNCAHPSHFAEVLTPGAPWMQRIRGIRANASRMSHAELDEATELDPGDPMELAVDYADLRSVHPHLVVLGGCCGTNHEHLEAIAQVNVRPLPTH